MNSKNESKRQDTGGSTKIVGKVEFFGDIVINVAELICKACGNVVGWQNVSKMLDSGNSECQNCHNNSWDVNQVR